MINNNMLSLKCSKCQHPVYLEHGKFCSNCGNKLKENLTKSIIDIDFTHQLWTVSINYDPMDQLCGIWDIGIYRGNLWDVICFFLNKKTRNEKSEYYFRKYDLPSITEVPKDESLNNFGIIDINGVSNKIASLPNNKMGQIIISNIFQDIFDNRSFVYSIEHAGKIKIGPTY